MLVYLRGAKNSTYICINFRTKKKKKKKTTVTDNKHDLENKVRKIREW